MPTAYHMVHYRRLSSIHFEKNKTSCENVCRNILAQQDPNGKPLWQRPEDRVQEEGDLESRQIMLNKVADLSSAIFGEMVLMQKGGYQAFLQMRAESTQLSDLTLAEVYQLRERSAPEGLSFVRGLMYWLIVENHLLFIKTQSMAPDHFTNYINWLFRTELDGASERVLAQAELDKAHIGGDVGDIQSLRVLGRSATGLAVAPSDGGELKTEATSRKIGGRLIESAKAIPLVELIFGTARAQSLMDSLGPEEYLAVDAEVKVRGRRTTASKDRLRALASEVADLTDAEVRIQGKDGTVKDGDAILRTRMPFSLAHEGSAILEFHNVADQLQEVYSRFVHDGKIASG